MRCRSCHSELSHLVIDLGFAPPSNAYLTKEQLSKPEKYYPLRVLVCDVCWLVQTEDFLGRDEVFDSEYHYFSSTSASWVAHALQYTNMITEELNLGPDSFVVEVASNDGYLLQHFKSVGIPCLGIEPTVSTAEAALSKGIDTVIEFFGAELALSLIHKYGPVDLLVGNNVFAHVPDINDFVKGIGLLLKPDGVCTLEFPHLLSLMQFSQFDTIYHEHFSYLSLIAIVPLFERHNLRVFKAEKLTTHGGSLRIYICKTDSEKTMDGSVNEFMKDEVDYGLSSIEAYSQLGLNAETMKMELLKFLISEKEAGRNVVGYGAAAKGNTFLNYAGIKSDLISYVVDAAESKQNKYMPGSHIPILPPRVLFEGQPETILILPWNIAKEVIGLNSELIESGANFFVAVPKLQKIER